MEYTEFYREDLQVGPTERPDDPLIAWHRALRGPLTTVPRPLERPARQPTPPSPDQEGCYFLG